jgi:hypothetical protein
VGVERSNAMSDAAIILEQTEEDILDYKIS